MSVSSVRGECPQQHHAAFDAAIGALPAGDQATAGGILANLIALLKSMGLSISWPCLIAAIPGIIAAFANPALFVAVITQYIACSKQTP